MRTAHIDCCGGVTGPMILGALIQAGAGLQCAMNAETVTCGGVAAVRATLVAADPSGKVLDWSERPRAAIKCLRQAHERVGAAPPTSEAVLEAAACAAGLDALGVETVTFSAVGLPAASAGELVPDAVSAELLRGVPVRAGGAALTAAGLAVLRALGSCRAESWPEMVPEAIGYGAGSEGGLLRLVVGTATDEGTEADTVWVIEANLDDMTGEALGFAQECLFEAGAVEVFMTPVQMKKNRPGTMLTAICPAGALASVEEAFLRHTSTFGVRRLAWGRRKLGRDWVTVATPWGEVRVKQGYLGGRLVRRTPEYEDCRKIALENNLSIDDVYREVGRLLTGRSEQG